MARYLALRQIGARPILPPNPPRPILIQMPP